MTISSQEVGQVVRNAPITRMRIVRMASMRRKRNQNNGQDTKSPGRTERVDEKANTQNS